MKSYFNHISREFLAVAVCSLVAVAPSMASVKVFKAGDWQLDVNTTDASATLSKAGRVVIEKSQAQWGKDSLRQDFSEMSRISATSKTLTDEFGDGIVVTVSGKNKELTVKQNFYLYEDKDYALTDFTVSSAVGVELNYMAPLASTVSFEAFTRPGNNIVFIPFDNDAWVRYSLTPFGDNSPESYEVTALFNSDTREGLIYGSIEHDTWKTGIEVVSGQTTTIDSLSVYGGAASTLTRDVRPHGVVKGQTVKSPKVMAGVFDDWRKGLETYADLCVVVAPRIESAGPRPFGWNSWGQLQTKINYTNATETAEFFKESLAGKDFLNEDGTVYIGLDAFWDFGFSTEQLRKFTEECHARGQKAGIYFCPFTDWAKNPENVVEEAPEYKWKELYLTHKGEPLTFDGAYAIDPTHPATKARIAKNFRDFIDWGFDYVKIDFMAHGSFESDNHYDPSVTTGIQAYNQGMAFIDSVAQGKLWINLSIAPLFPANYAHSRRIGCDAWADINNSEYTLNALTYGWWLDRVYHYNDADHIVLDGVTDGENRARLTSSAITGVFLLGDNLSESGNPDARKKAIRTATNAQINEIARSCKSFQPVEHGKGDKAGDMFYYNTGEIIYLAVFNYGDSAKRVNLALHRLGLSDGIGYQAEELWSGDKMELTGALNIEVPSKDVKVLKIKL